MGFNPYDDYGTQVPYALVIDTDKYAGNFERDMCAWITGFEGQNYPGGIDFFVKIAREQLGQTSDEIIELLGGVNHDEYGRCEVIMTNSPNDKECNHNSVAIMFDKKPSMKLLQLMAERARSFPDVDYQNAAGKSYFNPDVYEKIKVFQVRFEIFKVVVEKSEIHL